MQPTPHITDKQPEGTFALEQADGPSTPLQGRPRSAAELAIVETPPATNSAAGARVASESEGVGGVNRIVQCDALAFLRALPDACVDAIITDPPYCSGSVSEASRSAAKGQGLRSENIRRLGWFVGDNMGTAGLVWLLRAMAFEAVRVMKPTGSLLLFCDWRMVPNLAPAIESAGLRYQNHISWDKKAMGLGAGFRAQKEEILHFTNGSPEYHDKGTSNVLQCGRVSAEDREHQTQKPVALIAQLVRVVAPVGGLVLDPFAGSCTLAEACIQTRRNFLCVERDREHCATGESRILQVQPDFREGGGGGFSFVDTERQRAGAMGRVVESRPEPPSEGGPTDPGRSVKRKETAE